VEREVREYELEVTLRGGAGRHSPVVREGETKRDAATTSADPVMNNTEARARVTLDNPCANDGTVNVRTPSAAARADAQ
jgi:hypothetical protein